MVRIADHGLSLRVPTGWEARLWMPDLSPPAINLPVIRLTNDAMPMSRNTYAVEESEKLRRSQVVATLVEFDPALADVGLYGPQGVPVFTADDLDPRALQRAQEGRAGLQRFFSVNGRAFSLYVMARVGPGVGRAMGELHDVLVTLTVEPLAPREEADR
jgi:hypothetical protein